MQSPTVQEQPRSQSHDAVLNHRLSAGVNVGVDWRETGWFVQHEEDELAGFLFTEDYELRQGSD